MPWRHMAQQREGNRCESISVVSCAADRRASECPARRLDPLAVFGGSCREGLLSGPSLLCAGCAEAKDSRLSRADTCFLLEAHFLLSVV